MTARDWIEYTVLAASIIASAIGMWLTANRINRADNSAHALRQEIVASRKDRGLA